MQTQQTEKTIVLFLSDVAAMSCAFALAFLIGYKLPVTLSVFPLYAGSIYTVFIFTVVIFYILDLYSLRKLPEIFLHHVPILGLGLLLSSTMVTFTFFFFRNPIPRAVFILFYIISLLFIFLGRLVFNRLTMSSIFWNILLVGEKGPSEKIGQFINERPFLRSRVIGYISSEVDSKMSGLKDIDDAVLGSASETGTPRRQAAPCRCLGGLNDLLLILGKSNVSQVIVTTLNVDRELSRILRECMKRKIRISDHRRVMEYIEGMVPLDLLDDYWFILSLSHTDKTYFWYIKRSFDILAGLIGLCLAIPLLPVAVLLIKLDSRGPVFYSQERTGRDDKPFRVWKLRTMIEGADKNNVHWTTDNDARITRIGRLIRKTRLDELPQLLNILKGEMSLIGPRPEAVSLADMYAREIPYYRERHRVTPGITGWAQINYPYGNSLDDTREKLKYDFYYIKNRSFVLDMVIFLKTIRIVLTGKGAM